jgi:hypothetical protein
MLCDTQSTPTELTIPMPCLNEAETIAICLKKASSYLGEREAMPALHRWLGNPLLSFIGRIFFRAKLGDFHCGLRGFNTSAIRNLKLRSHGMEFASEMVVRCRLARRKC